MTQNCYFLVILTIISSSLSNSAVIKNDFKMTIIHLNDFHARFEETSPTSGVCHVGMTDCIGGIGRVFTAVRHLMSTTANPILLNAGDNYQGTLYFNLYPRNITQEFMNKFPFAAHTLGNHEFDNHVAGVVPFLDEVKASVVVANIDHSAHPELAGKYEKSVVITVGGRKIGIVGVIFSKTNELASTDQLIFLPESPAVNEEAERLQRQHSDLFTVIVLSHSGYDVDKEIARNASGVISVVVGAHSHTLLYNGEPPFEKDIAEGVYPNIIKRSRDGGDVVVVQASCYTKFLGNLDLVYDTRGQVINAMGLPVYLDQTWQPDVEITAMLKPYKEVVDAVGYRVLGNTVNTLEKVGCYSRECNLGNMIADAMLIPFEEIEESTDQWSADMSFMNAGGLRAEIPEGEITYYDLATAQPFSNTFDRALMSGAGVLSCLEQMALPYRDRDANMLQVAGLRVTIDLSLSEGERVTVAEVKQADGTYEKLLPDKMYKLTVPSFLVTGGDGFTCFDQLQEREVGEEDIQVLESYITRNSPLNVLVEGRITILNNQHPDYVPKY